MTLAELARMRRLRARPAMPVVLTDDATVHEFCTVNDFPTIWLPGLADDADLSPLHGLLVWIVGYSDRNALVEAVNTHQPESLWVVGTYGYQHRINEAIGRNAWTS